MNPHQYEQDHWQKRVNPRKYAAMNGGTANNASNDSRANSDGWDPEVMDGHLGTHRFNTKPEIFVEVTKKGEIVTGQMPDAEIPFVFHQDPVRIEALQTAEDLGIMNGPFKQYGKMVELDTSQMEPNLVRGVLGLSNRSNPNQKSPAPDMNYYRDRGKTGKPR